MTFVNIYTKLENTWRLHTSSIVLLGVVYRAHQASSHFV